MDFDFEEPLCGDPGALDPGGDDVGDDAGGRTVPRKGFPEDLKFTVAGNVGTSPEMLLLLMSKVVRDGKVVSSVGIEPVRLLLFRRICCSVVMFAKKGEIVPTRDCDASDMVVTSVPVPQEIPVHDAQGLGPSQLWARDCEYPDDFRNWFNAVTWTEHGDPSVVQKSAASNVRFAPAGKVGSSPLK